MFRKILKIILIILVTFLSISGLYFLLNGGFAEYGDMIAEYGFFGFIKEFFVGLWDGFVGLF